jgi:hypothetical protein
MIRLRLACISVALAATANAYADDTHYQDYPLGGRSVGLGGAYAAIADDPSGLFFNPAGIVNARRGSVQISTNLYGLEISESFFAAVERIGDFNTVATELNVIPTSASFTSVVEEDRRGRAITTYGFGSFVPSYRSLTSRSVSEVPPENDVAGCNTLAYRRSVVDRTFLFGGAMAHRMSDVWSFGVSGFLSYRTLSDQEKTSCFMDTTAGTSFADGETNLRMAVASLILSLGVMVELGEGFTVGANVTTPSIRAFDFADITVQQTSADPGTGESNFLLEELLDLEANTKTGPSFRLGGAYVLPRKLTVAADLTLHTGTRYRLFEVPDSERTVLEALTIAADIERQFTANFNVGTEWLLIDEFSISLGFYSNFSSAPEIPGVRGDTFPNDRLPNIDTFGGALVFGFFFGQFTLTRIGFTLSYGEGDDVVPRFAGLGTVGGRTEFVKADVSQLFAFFYVSSTFRY